MATRLTTQRFIEKSVLVHGDKFDYSQVNYINNYTKIKIGCNLCKQIFEQQPNNHFNGQGCPYCSGRMAWTTEKFIAEAIKIHSDEYDYSLVEYRNNSSKVKIICKYHGIFEQVPASHIHDTAGCFDCSRIKNGINLRKSQDKFVEEAFALFNNRYNYNQVVYRGSNTPVSILCTKCGMKFLQTPGNHLSGKGCSRCAVGISKPETAWLDFLLIPSELRQKRIKIGNSPYFVDGFDPTTNTVYEFYGDFWHGNPEKYSPDKMNKKVGKTFGSLYQRTIAKENALKSAGYKIISIWESEWKSHE